MKCCHRLRLLSILIVCLFLSGCENKVRVPASAEAYIGTDYKQAVEELSDLGFVNVVATEIDDLTSTGSICDGSIESISISGDTSFSAETKYPEDIEILITYHTFKKISPPLSSTEVAQYDYASLEQKFEVAGFTNVKMVEVEDLTSETKEQEGFLHSISINGTTEFSDEMLVPCNSEVIISLHTLKMVAIPISSKDLNGSTFPAIKGKFEVAGFKNVNEIGRAHV